MINIHSAELWSRAFPLIAIGLRMGGVTVIERPRQSGKTTELMDLCASDREGVLVVPEQSGKNLVLNMRQDFPCPVISLSEAEDWMQGRGGNLYVDDAEFGIPSFERYRHIKIKAVTYTL